MTNTNAALADVAEAKADALLNPAATNGHNQSPAVVALWNLAMETGEAVAAGQSAVTKLAFGFQELVRDGGAKIDDGGLLYKHHVNKHNDWVASNPTLGGKPLGASDEELKSSISTFKSFARKGPCELGVELYERVRFIREHMIPADQWAQKSTYNAFVKVNRVVADMCAKALNVAAFPVITDEVLIAALTKKPVDRDDLALAFAALTKAIEARPHEMELVQVHGLLATIMNRKAANLPCTMDKVVEGTEFTWAATLIKAEG